MSDATLLGGRYRLLDALGRGGMGTVYAAVQEGLGRRVAVKLLDPRLAEDRVQLERFRREAEVVAALGHPNIVQVTDFQYPDEANPQPFLVMELLHGESFGACLTRERILPGNRAAFIASQVLSALAAAHRAGVVHRDIKPDNIFLLSDAAIPDTVKVLDFGIAKLGGPLSGGGASAKLTSTGAMLGTPAFMAPEQARGWEDLDARADIYAVGATLYQALSGKLPYEASSIPALLFAIVEQTPAPLREVRPDLPPELVAVVERAMAKNRDVRFPDAESMREALAPWSGLKSTLHPPPVAVPVSVTAPTIASSHPQPQITPPPVTPPVTATPVVVHQTAPTQVAMYAPHASTLVPQRDAKRTRNRQIITALAIAYASWTILHKVHTCGDDHGGPNIHVTPEDKESARTAALALASQVTEALSPSTSAAPPAASTAIVTSVVPTAAASSAAPVVRHRYSGTHGYASFRDFGNCPGCDFSAWNHAIGDKGDAISACFKAAINDPPIHQSIDYVVGVDPSGALVSFKASDVVPRLDDCLQKVMMSIPLSNPRSKPASFRIGFSGECPKWGSPDTIKWCPE